MPTFFITLEMDIARKNVQKPTNKRNLVPEINSCNILSYILIFHTFIRIVCSKNLRLDILFKRFILDSCLISLDYFRNTLNLLTFRVSPDCMRREIVARRFATIRRRETGAMLLSLSAIYFLRRRCACESNVLTVRGRRS